jgi:hypothetical protein
MGGQPNDAARRCRRITTQSERFMLSRWLMALLVVLAANVSLAQDVPWVVKRVHGYRIALAVASVYESAQPGSDPRHARTIEHRLRVSVHEEGTGRAAALASIVVDVAESGYSGATTALRPIGPGAPGLYEGRARLRTEPPYRILVHATPAATGRTLEAQFEYRHHQ